MLALLASDVLAAPIVIDWASRRSIASPKDSEPGADPQSRLRVESRRLAEDAPPGASCNRHAPGSWPPEAAAAARAPPRRRALLPRVRSASLRAHRRRRLLSPPCSLVSLNEAAAPREYRGRDDEGRRSPAPNPRPSASWVAGRASPSCPTDPSTKRPPGFAQLPRTGSLLNLNLKKKTITLAPVRIPRRTSKRFSPSPAQPRRRRSQLHTHPPNKAASVSCATEPSNTQTTHVCLSYRGPPNRGSLLVSCFAARNP